MRGVMRIAHGHGPREVLPPMAGPVLVGLSRLLPADCADCKPQVGDVGSAQSAGNST